MGKGLIRDFRAKEDHLGVRVFRSQSTSLLYLFPLCNPSGIPKTLLGVLAFVLITSCEYVGVWLGCGYDPEYSYLGLRLVTLCS